MKDAPTVCCRLCGLPVGRSRLQLEEEGNLSFFCCSGCMQVYRILAGPGGVAASDFRSTDLYRRCLEAGIIGGPATSGAASYQPQQGQAKETTGLELTLAVEGMWCAACGWLIETVLARTPGILAARIDFLADLATVTYEPHRIGPAEITGLINSLGFRADNGTRPPAGIQRDLLIRLGVAAILTFNVMMISFALYGGFFQQLGKEGVRALSLPLGVLSTPVLFFSGAPILKRAWHGLINRCPGMDTLIAVSACTAFGYSLFQMFTGSIHLYFDTACMLITLVLFGTLIENRAREKVTGSLRNLSLLVGNKVRIADAGGERWIAATDLAPGDRVIVRAGERVPVDGLVAVGRADVDEGILTGEPRPRTRKTEDRVFAGSLLITGELRLIAERVGKDSSLGRLQDLLRRSLAAKNHLEQLADRITRFCVPLLFMLAGGTGLFLFLNGSSTETAMLRALTVLVIACPCALGIATPLAKTAVVSRGRQLGIIIRDSAAFETANNLDCIVFDKTGTVTEGNYCLRTIHSPGNDEQAMLALVAAVEVGSDHFLAREIRRQAATRGLSLPTAVDQCCYPGQGVAATVGHEEVIVGSRKLMSRSGCRICPQLQSLAADAETLGDSVVFAGWRNEVRMLLIFGDALQPAMASLIKALHHRGLELWLVSGDTTATTAAVAGRLGIEHFAGGNTAEDKIRLVGELQGRGKRVAMVGDGVNDMAALAMADLGVAVGGNPLDVAGEVADVTLLAGSLARITEMMDLSCCMVRTIRINLCLAFVYNAVGIPLAMAGLLSPLLAVLAMFASSLTVIANSLRVARVPPKAGQTAAGRLPLPLTDREAAVQ